MLYKLAPVFPLITELETLFHNRIKQTSQNRKKLLLAFLLFYQEATTAWFNNRQDFSGDRRNEKCEQLRTPDHRRDTRDTELDQLLAKR